MPFATDQGTVRTRRNDRPYFASLAHVKAHQVVALRELLHTVQPGDTAADVQARIRQQITDLQAQVAFMADSVAGHA